MGVIVVEREGVTSGSTQNVLKGGMWGRELRDDRLDWKGELVFSLALGGGEK